MSTPPSHTPYKDPSLGDLIIRTADGVDFHVHRRRLADVSPIFADMFSLPEPPTEGGKAVVDVSEGSDVWGKLLPIVHVDEEPKLSLPDIRNLLEASDKYQIPGLKSRMRTHLLCPDVLGDSPHAVYALACKARLEAVARAAARCTLKLPIYPPDIPEFTEISARPLFRLLQYRKKCAEVAKEVVDVNPAIPLLTGSGWISGGCPDAQNCNTQVCRRTTVTIEVQWYSGKKKSAIEKTHSVRTLWLDYLRELAKELEFRPHESVAHDFTLLSPVITSVTMSCLQCSPTIYAEASKFAGVVEGKIKEAISKVQLTFD